jgi:hypothetical protein
LPPSVTECVPECVPDRPFIRSFHGMPDCVPECVPDCLPHQKLPWNEGSKLAALGGVVPRLDVDLWDKLEVTPHGRMAKIINNPLAPPYKYSSARMLQNGYHIERGKHLVDAEFPRPKRCFENIPGQRSSSPPPSPTRPTTRGSPMWPTTRGAQRAPSRAPWD